LVQLYWKGPRKKGNVWRRWRSPVQVSDVVFWAAKTLRDAFGTPSPADLKIKRGVFPPLKDKEPDHFVAGVLAASMLLPRSMFRPIIGVPCGHKPCAQADSALCLTTLTKQGSLAALYKKMGRVFAVDHDVVALPISVRHGLIGSRSFVNSEN
jgi:hypothetical protein